MIKISVLFFVALIGIAGLEGCLLVPVVESVSSMGITNKDRQTLLNNTLKKFHEALYWENATEALAYVDEAALPDVKAKIKEEVLGDAKNFERKVVSVEFSPDARKADVTVSTKGYNPSTLIVAERRDLEKWNFSLGSSWMLVERQVGVK